MLVTSGPPTGALGHVGDIAVDNVNAYLYGPKTIDGWPTGINLSLGPTGPQSTVTGPTGPSVTGPTGGYSFAATGPTAPALTLAGSVWLDDSTGKYFVRYGNLWIEIGVQGERGVTGPTGAVSTTPGPTGPTGAASTVTGPTGAASTVTGPTGSVGPTGPSQGPTGPTGPGPRGGINVQDATGTIELDSSAAKYQFINAVDASRTVKLPTGVDVGYDLYIKETGAYYDLVIETTTATGVATLGGFYNPTAVIVVWDGSFWKVINF